MVITVVTTVMTTVVAIVIVVASVFVVSRAGSLFGFFRVGVSIHRLNQLTNGGRPLAVQLAVKLLMSEPFGKGSNGLNIGDVGYGVSCLRETPDKVAQRFPGGLMKLFQVILGARLLACSHVVVDEDFF